jgi:two-component system LytT family response regulator
MPFRVLVVDDEPLARTNVITLLKEDREIEVVGECGSGNAAVGAVRRLKPDILFLDIQMPDIDGFQVLEQLGAVSPKIVIFATAHSQYAIKAFEANALDYLLKPFDDARFAVALERAKLDLKKGNFPSGRIVLRESGRITIIEVAAVDWIEAQDYYACLHVGQKTHLMRKSLNELEMELDSSAFRRIHRSAIVNISRVTGLRLAQSGEYDVLLANGLELRLSRTYRRRLQDMLGVS